MSRYSNGFNLIMPRRSLSEEYQDFLHQWPSYRASSQLDNLRSEEFSRLDEHGLVYLDYMSSALHSSQIVYLKSQPQSEQPGASEVSVGALAEQKAVLRNKVRALVNDAHGDYDVIFTANAAAAMQLLAASFPFSDQSQLLLTEDNHNSVHVMRMFAAKVHSQVSFISICAPELRIDQEKFDQMLVQTPGAQSLVAIPAQSNVTGVQHDLDWVRVAQDRNWMVMIDAAAYMASNDFDVSTCPADFVYFSFYKMFGHPTGIGCLLARKASVERLGKQGLQDAAIRHKTVAEYGAPTAVAIAAAAVGLDWFQPLTAIGAHKRALALTGWLLLQMTRLRHRNGCPVVRIYGPTDIAQRGATIAFHVLDASGVIWSSKVVDEAASNSKIVLSAGYHSNPGCIEIINRISKAQLDHVYEPHGPVKQTMRRQDELVLGVIRVSLGPANNFDDAKRCIAFLATFRDLDVVKA